MMMNGILNVLKPPGMTSFDVVGYLRGVLKEKKIGHTGTLDPAAVGVLPICIGHATKVIEFVVEKDKSYRAELTLGVDTDTQDSQGEILRQCDVKADKAQIIEAIMSFVGQYNQIPPMYSAVKIKGTKLCDLARKGITVEREPRLIEIYSIDIKNISGNRVIFDVACSKGTYIRTLCADIGAKLGCGGHMSFLVRLKAGNFDISDAVTLEEIAHMAKSGLLTEKLHKVDTVFNQLPHMVVNEMQEKKLLNGVWIQLNGGNYKLGTMIRVYSMDQGFLLLGEVTVKEDTLYLKSKKLFI